MRTSRITRLLVPGLALVAATWGGSYGVTAGSDPPDASEVPDGSAPAASGGGSSELGPFKLGVINPNELFPDYLAGVEAAVDYVNAELDGLDGRPIELAVCSIDYNTPDDTQRCANELAAAEVEFALSTINQFGTHMQILRGAGIPVVVGTAVSVPDYTTEGVFSIAPGGGCVGTLTAMTKFAVQELGARRVAIPYSDIPSGVLCYADNEQKPIDVLRGVVDGATSPDAGSIPDVERLGIPVAPTEPDLTSVANQILDFDPDVIIFSSTPASCFPLLAALNSVGYSIDDVPFVMTTSCFDQPSAVDAGASADGLYFVGSGGHLIRPLDELEPELADEAAVFQEKYLEYAGSDEFASRNFTQVGFILVMSMTQRAGEIAADGGQVTGDALAAALAATENAPQFGSSPISCASAPSPYISVCNRHVNVTQWDGSQLQPIENGYNGTDLLDGTEIRTEPEA